MAENFANMTCYMRGHQSIYLLLREYRRKVVFDIVVVVVFKVFFV
jgi:hypothetical protein